jgi:hypothetical protein
MRITPILFALGCGFHSGSSHVDGDAGGAPDGAPLDAATDAPTDAPGDAPDDTGTETILPAHVTVPAGRNQTFVSPGATTWSVVEAGGGSVDGNGVYTAPLTPGMYHVTAAGPDGVATATVRVATFELQLVAGALGGAGQHDGIGAQARLDETYGVTYDGAGAVYFGDGDGSTIRKLDLASGMVTTVVGQPYRWAVIDGVGAAARVGYVRQLVYDGTAQKLYFIDRSTIRSLDLTTSAVTTIAGDPSAVGYADGLGAAVRFRDPWSLELAGTHLYVADTGNDVIRDVDLMTGGVSTLVGVSGGLDYPTGVAYEAGTLYVADGVHDRVVAVDVATAAVTPIAGSTRGYADGVGAAAQFSVPAGLALDHAGSLYVAEAGGWKIRKIALATSTVTTIAGGACCNVPDGIGTAAGFPDLYQIALAGDQLIVPDRFSPTIRKVDLATTAVTTIAGKRWQQGGNDGPALDARFVSPRGMVELAGKIHIFDPLVRVLRVYDPIAGLVSRFSGDGMMGTDDGPASTASYRYPSLAVADGSGGMYMTDNAAHTIRHIAPDGSAQTLWGNPDYGVLMDGIGTSAWFGSIINGIARVGNHMYVTDGNTIREIDLVTHAVTTRFGSTTAGFVDGLGTAARFNTLSSLAADSGHLYATDLVNGAIRVIDLATSEVTTLHVTDGAGTPVGIGGYGTLALSADGFLYVTAMGSLKRIYLATGKVDEIIGTPGAIAAVPGPLSSASLNRWRGELMFDSHGTLYLSQESGILRLVELP